MANPKRKEDAKRFYAQVRMSDRDMEILDECCDASGWSRSEVFRKGVFKVHKELFPEKQENV